MNRVPFVMLAFVAACGGKVVVDETGPTTGAGGAQPASSEAAGYPLCVTPAPIGPTANCGVASAGGPAPCIAKVCDADNHVWTADCSAHSCICRYNGDTQCTCVLQGEGDMCTTSPKCCPSPWSR